MALNLTPQPVMIETTIRTIAASQIKKENDWSLHPWSPQANQELLLSFSFAGVLHPPLVRLTTEGYELLSGHRRLRFLLSEKRSDICCRLVADTISDTELLSLILEEQLIVGSLSLAERICFLDLATGIVGKETVADLFYSRLGLKRGDRLIDLAAPLLAEGKYLMEAMHSGLLQEKVAKELLLIKDETARKPLVALFAELKLGENKQRRVLQLLQDLAGRQQKRISSLLQENWLLEIVEHKAMNVPQKTQRLLTSLEQLHKPLLSKAKKDFTRRCNTLKLPANWKVEPTQSFEREQVTLSLPFASLDHVEAALPELFKLASDQRSQRE